MTTIDRPAGRRAVLSSLLGTAALGLVGAACSSPGGTARPSPPPNPAGASTGAGATSTPGRKPLVAYFSRAGENYFNGGRIQLEVGNTAVVAGLIRDLADVDLYEIRPVEPYPDDYEATVRRNVEEQDADARPGIAGALPDLSAYDTILLGSGVWNVRAPMIMQTFVDALDFTGKAVLPFVTYAVSGMAGIRDDYARTISGATVGEGLAIRGEEVASARGEVEQWLRRNELLS